MIKNVGVAPTPNVRPSTLLESTNSYQFELDIHSENSSMSKPNVDAK